MSTTPTTNLNLIKNNADEPIANWRTNDNANMNALDTAIKAVQDATDTLEKARQNLNNLIGVLGKNSSNADLISKAQARANLDVAQSGGAAKTLYADEQTIAQNASLIASLQDSVSENILPSATGQNYVRFSRCHKTCTVNIYLTQSITFGTSYTWIATVPANARPANDLYAPVFDSAGNPLGGTLCIALTGGVGIKLSSTATPFVLTSIAWVV